VPETRINHTKQPQTHDDPNIDAGTSVMPNLQRLMSNGQSSAIPRVLRLQRLLGNRTIQRILASSEKLNPALIQRAVPLPNAEEQTMINNALTVLRQIRTNINIGNRRGFERYLEHLDTVMNASTNVNNAGTNIHTYIAGLSQQPQMIQNLQGIFLNGVTFAQMPNLKPHLEPLVSSMWRIVQESYNNGGPVGNTGEGVSYVAPPGPGAVAECLRAGTLSGLTFAAIDAAATGNGGVRRNHEIGTNGARSRIEWHWNDQSIIALDIPGKGAGEKYQVSYQPHIHK